MKAKDISAPPSSLSGGNQQKVVFAKLLNCDLTVSTDQPTKGIDVGAKYSIYEIMNELTANGYAIIMVSSEMPEVLGMADRIVVMRNGRVAGQFDTEGTTQEATLKFLKTRRWEGKRVMRTNNKSTLSKEAESRNFGLVLGLIVLLIVAAIITPSMYSLIPF